MGIYNQEETQAAVTFQTSGGLYFILSSSCAVADRVLIKSESHSGSVKIQRLRIPMRFSSASLPPCSATARVKEQCRCQIACLSLAHTPNPPTAPAPLHSWHHLHIKVAYIYEWTRLTTQYWQREEMDLIELWLLLDSFAWMFSCRVRRHTVYSRVLLGGGRSCLLSNNSFSSTVLTSS